jgi:hypothetical protein
MKPSGTTLLHYVSITILCLPVVASKISLGILTLPTIRNVGLQGHALASVRQLRISLHKHQPPKHRGGEHRGRRLRAIYRRREVRNISIKLSQGPLSMATSITNKLPIPIEASGSFSELLRATRRHLVTKEMVIRKVIKKIFPSISHQCSVARIFSRVESLFPFSSCTTFISLSLLFHNRYLPVDR